MTLLLAAACSAIIGCPRELRARIRSTEAMGKFADDDKSWQELLRLIGSGDPEWIDLEEQLAPFSDGYPGEEFTIALGMAVTHRPKQILTMIAAGKFGSNGIAICGAVDDDETIQADRTALRRRERAIQSVHSKNLQKVKRDCLQQIRHAKVEVKRFFKQ